MLTTKTTRVELNSGEVVEARVGYGKDGKYVVIDSINNHGRPVGLRTGLVYEKIEGDRVIGRVIDEA